MNLGVGLTLYVAVFPSIFLRNMQDVRQKNERLLYGSHNDGTMFKVIRPSDVTEYGLAGMRIRRVILQRGVALSLDQIELLHSRNRGTLRPEEFISVQQSATRT